MKKPQKATALIDYISMQVAAGLYPVGSRLPSVRRLAMKFALSYGTTRRGIGFLVEKGVLQNRDGKFCVAPIEPDTRGRKCISVFLHPNVLENGKGMIHTAFAQMQELAEEHNLQFAVFAVPEYEVSEQLILEKSKGSYGIVLLSEYDNHLTALNTHLPVVGTLCHHSLGGVVSTVNLDPVTAAGQAVDFFLQRKINQVAIATATAPVYLWRGDVFESMFRRAGGVVKWYYGWDQEWVPAAGEGILFTSDFLAESQILKMEKLGVDLTAYPILSMDGRRTLMPGCPSFPTIACDWAQIGRALFREIVLQSRCPERVSQHIYLEGKLVY